MNRNVRASGTGPLGSLYVYDLVATAWTDLSEQVHGIAPTARMFHGFSSADGMLYVHGGYDELYFMNGQFDPSFLDDLHSFDPVAKVWTDLSAPAGGIAPTARYGHGFTTADGKLYVHGGCASDACPATSTTPSPRPGQNFTPPRRLPPDFSMASRRRGAGSTCTGARG